MPLAGYFPRQTSRCSTKPEALSPRQPRTRLEDISSVTFSRARNSVFDANNYFNDAQGIPLPSLEQHQFGATLGGGPIRKSKLFFFVDYEGLRSTTGATAVAGVPTPPERTGDFSQLCTLQGGTFDGTGKRSVQAGQLYELFYEET